MLHVEDGKLNRERRGREGAPCGNGNYCKSGRESFVSPFSYQIDNVVKDLPINKAPGPDGFNGKFLKKCWPIIKEDFYKLVDDFYNEKINLESINTAFITLIPKKNRSRRYE
jgi:hypothetical protein